MTAVIINPDMTTERVEFAGYQTIKDAVGGWIEAAHTGTDITIWCDEEGKLKGAPVNPAATSLWWTINPAAREVDFLVGVILVTGGATPSGETQGLTEAQCEMIEHHAAATRTQHGQ